VYGIDLDDKTDEVVGMICVKKEDTTHTVMVVSEKGYGKRTLLVDEDGEDVYRVTNRGGKGVRTLNVTDKTGQLVGFLSVTESDDLMIMCKSGVTIRTSVDAIRTAGRATQGVRLIRLDEGDEIAAVTRIDKDEEEPTTPTDEQGGDIIPPTAEGDVAPSEN
jgi:DNA gyrase subunit A